MKLGLVILTHLNKKEGHGQRIMMNRQADRQTDYHEQQVHKLTDTSHLLHDGFQSCELYVMHLTFPLLPNLVMDLVNTDVAIFAGSSRILASPHTRHSKQAKWYMRLPPFLHPFVT